MQKTGAFKLRGALNKLMQMHENEPARGVVAASAGNHAQGVARAAREMNVPALIVMPKTAAVSKIVATRSYGADIILEGDNYDDAYEVAVAVAKERNYTLVHAFDDEAVAAGQGTIGLEILDDCPDVGTVVVPIGGGGLIAGMAAALKQRRPDIQVVGVEAAGAPAFYNAVNAGEGDPRTLASVSTIADGIAVRGPGRYTYPIVRRYVDDIVTVTDDEIAGAILFFMERMKTVVEGAGAASLAALLAGRIQNPGGRPVVGVVSGGNIDVDVIARIIERGLVRSGRRMQLRVLVPDQPGALHRMTGVIAATQANVIGIDHDRTSSRVPIGRTEVILILAVHDAAHGAKLVRELEEAGYAVDTDLMKEREAVPNVIGSLFGSAYGMFE